MKKFMLSMAVMMAMAISANAQSDVKKDSEKKCEKKECCQKKAAECKKTCEKKTAECKKALAIRKMPRAAKRLRNARKPRSLAARRSNQIIIDCT